MKTAMQELIEKIELNDYWIPNHIKNELLEKEKEQIIEIANKARETTVENSIWGFKYNPEEIYSQYNQNK